MSYSQEERNRVLSLCSSSYTITEISRMTGVPRGTIYRWINNEIITSNDNKKISFREAYDLKRRVKRLETIIDFLQEVNCTTYSTNVDKCKIVESKADKYGVKMMCAALKLDKGTYYNYANRGKHGRTFDVIKKEKLTPIIEDIFTESKGIYGAPKICAILRERGYSASVKFVSGIMRENGWFSSRGGAKRKYINQKRTNVIKRQFKVSKPNEVWVGDVTEFKIDGLALYLCVVLDLYARKVIAFRISRFNNTQLTKRTIKEAFDSREKPEGTTFHSDQGNNYTSRRYQDYLKECGITQSFSKPGTPYDNSVMESFFKNLKNERLYIMNPHTEKEFKQEVCWYIRFYNSERPHETNHYMTPEAFESQYYKKQQ